MNILYFIPILLLGAAIWTGRRAYISYMGGGERVDNNPGSPTSGKWTDTGTRVINKGATVFAIAFFIAAIVIFFSIKSDYRKPKSKDETHWQNQKEREK